MTNIFLIGDDETLIAEFSKMLDDNFDIKDTLTEDVEIVFELTNYNEEMKSTILDFIDSKNPDAVIVSSSVCIPVLTQSAYVKNPSRLTGISCYRGFSEMKAIELARSPFTSDESFNAVSEVFKSTGKEVILSPDRVGMIALRIICMIINEAYLVLQEGTSNREDIDTAMKLGTNYPFGPIEWSEKLGIDLVYNILFSMLKEFGEDRYRITPLLKEKHLEESLRLNG